MNELLKVLEEAAKIPGALAAVAAVAGLIGTLAGAAGTLLGVLLSRFVLSPRDLQDREVEWRKHAVELTKLDLDRKIRTRPPGDTRSLRPSILDFLANYRDLQELGATTPKDLYLKIERDRIADNAQTPVAPKPAPTDRAAAGTGDADIVGPDGSPG